MVAMRSWCGVRAHTGVTLLPFWNGVVMLGVLLGSGGDGYGVTTEALVSAGDTFVDMGDSVAQAASTFAGELEGQSGVNEGFVTRKTAGSLALKWQQQTEDLATRTSVVGDLLQEGSDG